VSYSVDVNVLLHASDRSSDRHARARRFVESSAAGPEILCLTWPTLMSYLRIATHPRIFSAPLSPDEALGNIVALINLPHVRALSELDGFVDAYKHMTAEIPVRGNLVPDAHVATILFQHGIRTLYTSDRDFRKFQSLDVRDPFGGGSAIAWDSADVLPDHASPHAPALRSASLPWTKAPRADCHFGRCSIATFKRTASVTHARLKSKRFRIDIP
jgi:toxin-antitoxin system PIN domain toxin